MSPLFDCESLNICKSREIVNLFTENARKKQFKILEKVMILCSSCFTKSLRFEANTFLTLALPISTHPRFTFHISIKGRKWHTRVPDTILFILHFNKIIIFCFHYQTRDWPFQLHPLLQITNTRTHSFLSIVGHLKVCICSLMNAHLLVFSIININNHIRPTH